MVVEEVTDLRLIESGHAGRDAEYLAVTRLQADALITVDPRLAAAARDVVAVAAVDDLLAPG